MKAEKNIQVFQQLDELNTAAASLILRVAKESVALRGKFVIALSGGKSPNTLFAKLAGFPYAQQMPWAQTFVFWGDERCVPFDDPGNNSFHARCTLLNKVPVPASHIYPIPVNLSPSEAASKYEQELFSFFKDTPRFDFSLLGLGENGHTASLFPNTPVLNEQIPGIREVYDTDGELFRITMTAPLINLARHILFVVTGQNKAPILRTVLTTSFCPEKYPSQLINPTDGELYWFVDKEAWGDLIAGNIKKNWLI
jgi:6-phosphogluconolactonase